MAVTASLHRLQELLLPGNWEIAGFLGEPRRAHEIVTTHPPAFVLEGPFGSYWADPMLYRHGGRTAVLFEEYLHGRKMAHLVAQEIDDRGRAIGEARRIVADPWYMSFPHCVEVNGTLYLIPETTQIGRLIGYPCRAFPFDWAPHVVLFDGLDGADTTLHVEGDTVYLLTSERGGGGPDDRGALSVYRCETAGFPHAPWTPVPIGERVRGRNAGPLFRCGAGWIRPAQVSIHSYGEKVRLCEVTRLSPQGYDEREIGLIEPVGGSVSHYHTLSSLGDLFVIDRKRVGLGPLLKAHTGRLQRVIARARGVSGHSCG